MSTAFAIPFLQPISKLVQSLSFFLPFVLPKLRLLLAALLELLTPIRNVSLQLLAGEKPPVHQPHTSSRCLGVCEPDRSDPVRFLVEEDYICDVADFGAFVADVFFDFEESGRILLG